MTAKQQQKPDFQKPAWIMLMEGKIWEGERLPTESITEQKGWLSPGAQLRRLTEAGTRLETFRMENYDEYYYGQEEPSLDPIRRAEDIQDEMLIVKQRIERATAAQERLKEALEKRQKVEAERAEKAEREKYSKWAAEEAAKKSSETTEETP
jgi:hypothetical protein